MLIGIPLRPLRRRTRPLFLGDDVLGIEAALESRPKRQTNESQGVQSRFKSARPDQVRRPMHYWLEAGLKR